MSGSGSGPDDEISAGLGDYASFKQEMLDLIPRVVVNSGGESVSQPLARLDRNVPTDPTLALVDAFAMQPSAGLLRLGAYIKVIPYPVTVGVTAGSGVVTSGLPESQFHSSAPVSTSKARMTPDGSSVE